MNAFRSFLRMGSVLAVLVLSASLAYAWPGLVHILITEEAGYPELKFYANGPDTYESTQLWYEGWMPSNYFSWTHIRLTVRNWGAPIEGVEDPAYDMWVLATSKLQGLSGQELDVARKTALGSRAHMAAGRWSSARGTTLFWKKSRTGMMFTTTHRILRESSPAKTRLRTPQQRGL